MVGFGIRFELTGKAERLAHMKRQSGLPVKISSNLSLL
jgi:hypothetical protein